MKDLTDKQAEFLKVVLLYIDEHGFSPSCVELAEYFGWKSSNNSSEKLLILKSKGYLINIAPGVARGYRPGPKADDFRKLKLNR